MPAEIQTLPSIGITVLPALEIREMEIKRIQNEPRVASKG
jgi:hypothetical protein